jgi:hypothetical protein
LQHAVVDRSIAVKRGSRTRGKGIALGVMGAPVERLGIGLQSSGRCTYPVGGDDPLVEDKRSTCCV